MNYRRYKPNQGITQIGRYRYKLGKRKSLLAATRQAQEHKKINYSGILPQILKGNNTKSV